MKTPQACTGLADIRHAIDSLDQQIIDALGLRMQYVKAASAFKPDQASIAAPERVAAMLPQRRQWAQDVGLDGEFIESLFEQYAVPPERICFELTETAAVANLTKTADFVRQLQKIGCTFAIDDFGTGFSSYDYLKRLPVDFVKIDGSFVKEIERSPSDLAMVKSINEIAHVLGRKTIAEYVETQSIREQLAALGIDYVQGYGVERPRPLSEYLQRC